MHPDSTTGPDYRSIPLIGVRARGRSVLVDAADYDRLSVHSWYVCGGRDGYAARHSTADDRLAGHGVHVYLHHEVLGVRGLPKGQRAEVDHINGNKLDCRRANLRVVSTGANQQNRPPRCGCTSRFLGVCWRSGARYRKRWRATCRVDGRRIELGLFATDTEAAMAYDTAVIAAYGPDALTNAKLFGVAAIAPCAGLGGGA